MGLLLTAGLALILLRSTRQQRGLADRMALASAELYSRALTEFRTLYTSEVVDRVREAQLEVTHDYKDRAGAIPLPATLSIELGERIGAQDGGAEVHVYSPYPFPWRATEGGLRDDFGREAWSWLEEHPDETFHRFEVLDGREVLRFATADRMQPGCVRCHNSHPDSPKRDWREGDVRGVSEIVYPLHGFVGTTDSERAETVGVLALVAGLWFSAVLVFVRRLRRDSRQLEQEVEERTLALSAANARLEQEAGERERTQQALAGSEYEYRLLTDNVPVGIASFDAEARYLLVNAEYTRMVQRTREELEGRRLQDTLIEAGFAPQLAGIESVLAGQTYRFERELPVPNGSSRWLEVTYVPRWDGNRVAGFFSLVVDLTSRKESEQERAELRERLHQQQKLEALGTLAGGIAHDFNNLLAVVLSNAELSSELLPPESPVQTFQEQITLSGRRAAELVEQILTFSRQEEGSSEVLDATPVVRETLELLRATLPEGLAFELRADSPELLVRGHAGRLQQVVMNLCTNAVHAMPDGGTLRIELGRERSAPGAEEFVRLEFHDTGCGMDAETRARIFDPFFTTKGIGRGTGLGLATTHGIIERMGGTIAVESRVGSGTSFRILLPAADGGLREPDEEPELSESNRAPAHVLLVDDEPTVLGSIERLLEFLGHTVSPHGSAEAAAEAFLADPLAFDLVMTDLTMPGQSGLELARRLREVRPELPVVLLSGDLSRAPHPLDLGMQGLQKPVRLQQIRACLREGLVAH